MNRYYGQGLIDEYLNNNFIKDRRDGFFVECGAGDGLTESTCKFFEESLGWSGINIEPAPVLFGLCVTIRPNCSNLRVALSDENKTAIFTNAIHPALGRLFGNGSLSHTKEHRKELIKQGCVFETFPVQCVRFDSLSLWEKQPIDLFVLDVEGHELKALKGILPVGPRLMCIEYTWVGLDNLEKAMLGYKLESIHENNAIFELIKGE